MLGGRGKERSVGRGESVWKGKKERRREREEERREAVSGDGGGCSGRLVVMKLSLTCASEIRCITINKKNKKIEKIKYEGRKEGKGRGKSGRCNTGTVI